MPDSLASLPAPHGDKLRALLRNKKLPRADRPRVKETIARYEQWRREMESAAGPPAARVTTMTRFLNDYKRYVDLNLIFDSENDFLYRQKGQLKLDNTILEEFLPLLVTSVLFDGRLVSGLFIGPASCFSGVRFESAVLRPRPGAGMQIRQKDHDFVIARPLFIRASHDADFNESVTGKTRIAYVAAECKTNLDKTMFQEAAATALDVKLTTPAARYYLLCEWLDMTPINSGITAIDEIIVLRKAKRLPANTRRFFSAAVGRKENRALFAAYLDDHPFAPDTFLRFLEHIQKLIAESGENDVLARGYF